MKNFKLALMALSCVFIFGCKGKQSTTDTATETTPVSSSGGEAITSNPLSFDAAGSDSGKIDGLKTVHFDFDKSNLTDEAKEIIKGNAEWMKKNGKVKVQIEGHCDNRGTNEYNMGLGERRANAVKNMMISLGIPSARLSVISYGEEKPLMQGDDETAWAANRRANFVPAAQ